MFTVLYIKSLGRAYCLLQICPLKHVSYLPIPHSVVATIWLSVFMSLAFLDSTYKCYHKVLVFFCLTYLSIMCSRSTE